MDEMSVNECMMTKDVQLNLGHFGVGCRRKVLTVEWLKEPP